MDFANVNIRKFSRDQLGRDMASANWPSHGRVTQVIGNIIEVSLGGCQLGSLVEIALPSGKGAVLAEVVGFRDEKVLLLPFGDLGGISPGCMVSSQSFLDKIPVGDFLLGQVVDPFVNSLAQSRLQIPERSGLAPIEADAPNPMIRSRVTRPLGMGIRSIDGLLSIGDGQRVGIMAGAGVGKSVLLGMIARDTDADVNVIGLIGERGREVREFLERDLGPEGLARSVVVVVTSDQSPLMKIRGAKVATAIAEHFSRSGKRVLLMMDSLTRVAMAQREIGLSIGEPPTTKGYTPSVFSMLPRLLERSGPQPKGCGNISAMYTVLVDGDDFTDPIADAARSILDGHIQLSRQLAAKGQYPAIDVSSSVSRVMSEVVEAQHLSAAQHVRSLIGVYMENFDLIQIGAYQPGTNPLLDEAMQKMPAIEAFLKQAPKEISNFQEAMQAVQTISQFGRQQQANEAGYVQDELPQNRVQSTL